jgi:predicted DNA-binding transcriptional regulator YafY
MPTPANAVAIFKFSGSVDSISHHGGGNVLQLTFTVTNVGKTKVFTSRATALEQGHHHTAMLQLLSQAMTGGQPVTIRYTHRAGGVLEPFGLHIAAAPAAKSAPATVAKPADAPRTPTRRTARKR